MKKILKWVAIIFVVLIVIGLIFGKDDKKVTSTTPENTTTTQSAEMPQAEVIPPLEITSDEILKAYKTNEIAANKRFKGQTLLVTGKIESIEADFSDDPVIVFKTADQYEFLKPRASLTKEEQDKAADLSKGQNIKLLCSKINEVAGMPTISECLIQ